MADDDMGLYEGLFEDSKPPQSGAHTTRGEGSEIKEGRGQDELLAALEGVGSEHPDMVEFNEIKRKLAETTRELTQTKRQLERTQKEKEAFEKMNIALKKNISCLYKTAKLECDRKAEEIKTLRDKVEAYERGQAAAQKRP
eukprot:comp6799_c0_seq1/m.2541 comp6799_c0_seq1/g.2541  ORF comp6799_c0_seq1/g.2541 comp6799_c0_seq1/m.2541 type:complete len:141 (-) comp6799_c0_seq1:189-611(-)